MTVDTTQSQDHSRSHAFSESHAENHPTLPKKQESPLDQDSLPPDFVAQTVDTCQKQLDE